MKIQSIWFKGKDPKERESIEYILRNNQILLTEFLRILDEYEQEEDVANLNDYDSASWAYKQADRNGAKRAIRKIRTLFKFMETTS